MIYLVKDDTKPLDVTLSVASALTGATVAFRMVKRGSPPKTVSGACTILDAALKQVRFTFAAGDLDTAGIYDAEWSVTWPAGGGLETIPNRTTSVIYVRPDLD